MKKRLLVMEDDKRILDILSFAVGREGYYMIRAGDGLTGLRLASKQKPDLILLDLTHTEPDSIGVYRGLRADGLEVPILFLISSSDDLEEAGLDSNTDCMKKPFSMRDLLMRIKVNTGYQDSSEEEVSSCQVLGRFVFDPEQVVVTKDGIPLDLRQREYDLLCFLAQKPGKVFSREELLLKVWGYTYLGDTRNVDVTVRRLREKIEDDPAHPAFILTRRGCGYVFMT